MMDYPRSLDALTRLLNLARTDAQSLRTDLTDLERVRHAAQSSLDELERTEHSGAASDTNYAAERRFNLQKTLMTLSGAEESIRTRLETAETEIDKLQQLIAINARLAGQKPAAVPINPPANDLERSA